MTEAPSVTGTADPGFRLSLLGDVRPKAIEVKTGEAPPVGILFVHGIGSQPQSSTLREFGGAVTKWVERWYSERPTLADPAPFQVHRSVLQLGSTPGDPPWFSVSLPAAPRPDGTRADPQKWVLAEAWWASDIVAPSFAEMWKWSWTVLRRATGRLGLTLIRSVTIPLLTAPLVQLWPSAGSRRLNWENDREQLDSFWARSVEAAHALLLGIGYLIGGVLGYLVLVPIFIAAQIPVGPWKDFLVTKVLSSFLMYGLGDFKTYTHDDVQALNMRRRVDQAIDWLATQGSCAKIIVIAHSQGAVVAFDALSSDGARHIDRVSKFITVGGALNSAWALVPDGKRLRGKLRSHIYWLDIWSPFDPVPGEQLDRGDPVVEPDDAVWKRYGWTEARVRGKPDRSVPVAQQGRPTGPHPRAVRNTINILSEHDAYWRNDEQVLSRLAQEIDVADGAYGNSRFALTRTDHLARVEQRLVRVMTLAGWRLVAMASFAAAILSRALFGGTDRLIADGRSVLGIASAIGLDSVVKGVGDVIAEGARVGGVLTSETLSRLLLQGSLASAGPFLTQLSMEAVARAMIAAAGLGLVYLWLFRTPTAPRRVVQRCLTALLIMAAAAWVLVSIEALVLTLVGVAALGAAYQLVYVLVVKTLHDPWETQARRDSVRAATLPRFLVLRTVAALGILVSAAGLIARAP